MSWTTNIQWKGTDLWHEMHAVIAFSATEV
jgi:hypothetical protein